jgi:hypothetical protein
VKLCLLVPGPPPSGDAAGEHARRLAADHGVEVTVALCEDRPAAVLPRRANEPHLVPVEDALRAEYDVALAAGWAPTVQLFSVNARRRAMLVERFEHEHLASDDPDRVPAALAYDLPVDFIATAQWIGDALGALRPDARCLVVRNGIDRSLYAPPESRDGPLRVVADARGGEPVARAAVAAATAPLDVTWVDAAQDLAARAEVLRGADATLLLDPVDGALGLPLEGFAAGATTVIAAAGGATDLVRDGVNGFVVEPDDAGGAARQLDVLASDGELLRRLRAQAAETVRSWPSLDQASADMRAALDELIAGPPPDAARWPVRLMADAMAQAAILRGELHALRTALAEVHDDGAYRAAQRLRASVRGPRFAPIRKVAAPVVARVRARRERR